MFRRVLALLPALVLIAPLAAGAESLAEAVKRSEALQDQGRWAEAAAVLEAHADEADGEAAFLIAQSHLFAIMMPLTDDEEETADVSQVRRWIDRALELGNPRVYQLLYVMHANGVGDAPDWDRAVQYLRTGTEKGDQGSKLNLAILMYKGIPPVEKDVPRATLYFKELAQLDPTDMVTAYYLGVITFIGEGAVPADEVRGLEMIERAANHGLRDAERDMGKALEYGWAGREVDLEAALEWHRKAAELGEDHSLWRLGLAHARGDIGPADPVKAVEYFRRSAENGNTRGMTSLGVMYATGEGVEQDFAEARRWYEQATELGNSQAMKNLAVMYYQGQGVEVDLERARELAIRAREAGNEEAGALLRLIEDAMAAARQGEPA